MESEKSQNAVQRKNTAIFLEGLGLVMLFVALLLWIRSIVRVYGIPYGIDFGEGYLANASLGLVLGENPYHSINDPPWIVTSYPPLFLIINGLITAVVGLSLIPGRFLASISLVGVIAVAIFLLRRLGITKNAAILSAGTLLIFPWPVNWSQIARVDTLGLLLVIGGIYFWIRNEKKHNVVLSGILFALALFTKQSFLAGPAAVVFHGILSRDRRTWLFLATFLVSTGILYGIAGVLTGGWIFAHLFKYTANAYFLGRFTAGAGLYLKTTWLLQVLALSAFAMPGALAGRRPLIGWYYFFAHLGLITYGYEGSDINYLIEPLLSTALLAGVSLDTLKKNNELVTSHIPFPPATVGYTALIFIFLLGRFINPSAFKIERVTSETLQNGIELIHLAASQPGEMLSEDASFTFLAGKTVIFQPYIMTLLSRTGKWDQEPFVETIRQRKYALIILRVDLNDPHNTEVRGGVWEMAGFDRWTEEMEEAIKANYKLYGALDVGVGNPWFVYLPIESPDSQVQMKEYQDLTSSE